MSTNTQVSVKRNAPVANISAMGDQIFRQKTVDWLRESLSKGSEQCFDFVQSTTDRTVFGESRFSKIFGQSPFSGLTEELFHAGIVYVDAKYTDVRIYKNVLVKMPNISCLRSCDDHFCAVPVDKDLEQNPEIIFVPKHFRQTLFVTDEQAKPVTKTKVFRNFFVKENFLNRMAVCDIIIQAKHDFQTGEEHLVINYQNVRCNKQVAVEYDIKIGVSQMPENSDQILIPGSKQCLSFIKRNA